MISGGGLLCWVEVGDQGDENDDLMSYLCARRTCVSHGPKKVPDSKTPSVALRNGSSQAQRSDGGGQGGPDGGAKRT